MNRRGFIGSLFGAVAGVVLEQAIPLGRVWSFPSEIVVPAPAIELADLDFPAGNSFLPVEWVNRKTLELLKKNLVIGTRVQVRFPQRYIVTDDDLDLDDY